MKRKRYVKIGPAVLIVVERSPNTLTFKPLFDRSPEFRAIKEQLMPFLVRYLPAVEVRNITPSRPPSVDGDDAALVMKNLPRKADQRGYYGDLESFNSLVLDIDSRIWTQGPVS